MCFMLNVAPYIFQRWPQSSHCLLFTYICIYMYTYIKCITYDMFVTGMEICSLCSLPFNLGGFVSDANGVNDTI